MITVILLLVATFIIFLVDRPIHKASDTGFFLLIMSDIIIDNMLTLLINKGSTTKYVYYVNGFAGATDSNTIFYFFLLIMIIGVSLVVFMKLSEPISRKIFKKDEDKKNEKLGITLIGVATILIGIVAIRYIMIALKTKAAFSIIYALILLIIMGVHISKYFIKKNYRLNKLVR